MKPDITKYITENLPERIYLYVGKKPAVTAIYFKFHMRLGAGLLRFYYSLYDVVSDQKKNLSKSQKKIQKAFDEGNSWENIFIDSKDMVEKYTDYLYGSKPCLNDTQLLQNLEACKAFLMQHNLITKDNKVFLTVEEYKALYVKRVIMTDWMKLVCSSLIGGSIILNTLKKFRYHPPQIAKYYTQNKSHDKT